MPGNVRDHGFSCDLHQLLCTCGFQMLPEVPDDLLIFLIDVAHLTDWFAIVRHLKTSASVIPALPVEKIDA